MLKLMCLIFVIASAMSQQFQCPEKDGFYPDDYQCDKYYECRAGKVHEKLCADGLVFDENLKRYSKCDQPYNVDCGDRTELQTPKGTNEYCPRKNGIFSHPDETICNIFYTCVDGEYIENKCPPGLHYDELSATCVWPDTANRENCQENKMKLKDGFVCPSDRNRTDKTGQVVAHPHYAHPTDCQRFYVCLNGIEPRELVCEDGEVFSEETKACANPASVPGCEDWFTVTESS